MSCEQIQDNTKGLVEQRMELPLMKWVVVAWWHEAGRSEQAGPDVCGVNTDRGEGGP